MRARLVLFVPVLAAVQLVRCGADDGGSGGGGGGQLPDVVYDGEASDEAWAVIYPRLGRATVKESLRLTSPTGVLHASSTPTFTWEAQASRTPRFPGSAWPLPLGPAVAAAHLPPVTGTVVLLEISGATTLRVLTTEGSWIPATADWQAITGGRAGSITVNLHSVYLNENVIEEGPFRSPAPATFEVREP